MARPAKPNDPRHSPKEGPLGHEVRITPSLKRRRTFTPIRVWTHVDRRATSPNSIPFVLSDWTAGSAATIGASTSAALAARPHDERGLHISYAAYFWPPSWINYADPLTWFRTGPSGYAAALAYATTYWAQFTVEPRFISIDHEEYMSTFRYPTPGATLSPAWSDPASRANMPAEILALNPAHFDAGGETRRLAINPFNQWAVNRDTSFLAQALITGYITRFKKRPVICNYDCTTYPPGYTSVNNFTTISTSLLAAFPPHPTPSLPTVGCPVLYPYLDDVRAGGSTSTALSLTIRRLTDSLDPVNMPWLMVPGGLRSNGSFDEYPNCTADFSTLVRACRSRGVTDILLFDWSPTWTNTTKPDTACSLIAAAQQ